MNQEQDMNARRLAGAEAIVAKAIALAKESGIEIERCVWDIGEDLNHEHAHRLDLFTKEKTVRLYFPDLELTAFEHGMRKKRTEDRLKGAVAQLLPNSPAETYSFR